MLCMHSKLAKAMKQTKETEILKKHFAFYEHWKLGGVFMSQILRTKPSDTGTLRLKPRTLALIAVHRQTAASTSTRPPNSLQHGFFRGVVPTSEPSRPPSTLPHAQKLIASLGHMLDFLAFWNANGGLRGGSGKAGGSFGVPGNTDGGLEGSGKLGGSFGGYCIRGFEKDMGGEIGVFEYL